MTLFLSVAYLFYPTLSLMQLQAYQCESFDATDTTQVRVLRADRMLRCDSPEYLNFIRLNVV